MALNLVDDTARLNERFTLAMGQWLSADQPMPLFFSHAPLFRHPRYALFAQIAYSEELGDYVRYTVVKRKEGIYDHDGSDLRVGLLRGLL